MSEGLLNTNPVLFAILLPVIVPVVAFFLAFEVAAWAWTGRKPWREPGRPTIGTHVFGWLGADVSEYPDEGGEP